jgi:Flp pilus assembly protein TadG
MYLAKSQSFCWSLIRAARRLLGDQNGTAAIETAFALPLLLVLMTGIVDMGYMFVVKSNMASVSQDTARLVAIGNMTQSQATDYAKTKLMASGLPYSVNATIAGQDVIVDIRVPNKDVTLIDFLGIFQTGNLAAKSTMRVL